MEFKLEIKNLALSDSKGHDLQKEIVVRVTAVGKKQVSLSVCLSCTIAHKLFFLQVEFSFDFSSVCLNSLPRCGFGPRPSL